MAVWEFVKRNWKLILVGIISLTIGFLLQVYANYRSERRIIEAIVAEIQTLKEKQTIGRTTAEDQKRLIELEAQLRLLTS